MAIKPDTLRRLLIVWTLALAFYQFSENTADIDLWAHTLFGQQLLHTGVVQKTEIFSWTARGQPWINHEVLSEVALGAAHRIGGGPGILALKILVGFLTLGIAVRLGGRSAWLLAPLAVVEISFGFAARPQIFTALGLAVEFWLLRQVYEGRKLWALALPAIFVLWINTHGGALAGLALLFAALGANVLERRAPLILWIATALSGAAMLANPWGFALPRSIVEADMWNRSAIQEWHATPLGWDHAAMFILLALTVVSFWLSRLKRAYWEMAACGVLAVLALKTVRHTPLFSIAALSFAPPHFDDALDRFHAQLSELQRKAAAIFLATTAPVIFAAAFFLHKEHPLTMEVPRNEYPMEAIAYIKRTHLRGNALTFFDWGELCLWELPDTSVSMDGRLDTCYSYPLIEEHWKFYNGESVNTNLLNIDAADFALLPANLAGTAALAARPGWRVMYVDKLAAVLARRPPPSLAPEQGSPAATTGSDSFPNKPSPRVYKPVG